MKKFFVLIALFSLALAGCNADIAATLTAMPPTETATQTPTLTPSPAPTETATEPPSTVLVTFRVLTPVSTGAEIHMAGDFPGTDIPSWVPYSIVMDPDFDEWTTEIELPIGAEVSYQYTRGSWGSVEANADCSEAARRWLTVPAEPVTVEDEVAAWADLCE